jgi:hypothetical protein
MKTSRLAVFAVAAALAAASCGTKNISRDGGTVSLVYGGAPGSSKSWAMEQVFKGKILSGGMPQLVVIRAHASITETVVEEADGGWKKVRLATMMQPLEVNGMLMETGALPPSVETVAMRSPSGEVKELEKAPGGKDVLAWVARSLGSTFPILPPAPVNPGETWEKRTEIDAPFGGTFETVTIGVFEGFEDVDGVRCARLRMEGGVNLAGSPADAEVSFFRLQYKGVVRFDRAAGRVVDSSQSGSLNVRARMGKVPVEAMMLFESTLKPAGVK